MTNARDKANIPVLNFQSKGIDDNADATAVTINSSEQVGIGTTNFDQDAKLTIASSGSGGANPSSINSNTIATFRRTGGLSHTAIISVLGGSSASSILNLGDRDDEDVGNITYGHSSNHMAFTTGASERMRLNSTGLGIGTSAPSVKLDVRATSFTPYNTNTSLIVEAPAVFSQAQHFYIHNAGSYNSSRPTGGIGAVNASSLISLSAGSICNGNTGADGFKATATTSSLYDIGSGNHEFKTKTGLTVGDQFTHQTKMIIKDSGSVGIGTTSPSATLHVDTSNSGVALNSEADDFFVESNSHTGMTIGSGSSHRSSIYFANSSDNDIGRITVSHSDGTMRFHNNASERVRIDANGNFGIGTTSPGSELHVVADNVSESWSPYDGTVLTIENNDTDGCILQTVGRNTATNEIWFGDDDSRNIGRIRYEHSNDGLEFWTNGSEKLRIDSNGRQTFNGSSTTSGHGNFVGEVGSSFRALAFEHTNGGGIFGHVTTNGGGSVSYNTTSDYRLKENVSYDFDATSRLKQLKPARFNFIADADTTIDGFLAHEVSSVVPEAITGTKDAVDEDGNPDYQAIDQSKLVPLLVKTIQELEARITTLEANNP